MRVLQINKFDIGVLLELIGGREVGFGYAIVENEKIDEAGRSSGGLSKEWKIGWEILSYVGYENGYAGISGCLFLIVGDGIMIGWFFFLVAGFGMACGEEYCV